jgi:hypothetical protein
MFFESYMQQQIDLLSGSGTGQPSRAPPGVTPQTDVYGQAAYKQQVKKKAKKKFFIPNNRLFRIVLLFLLRWFWGHRILL